MAGARIIPIIIQVQPGAGGTAVVTQITNAFKQLNNEVQNTSHSASGLSFKSLIGVEALGGIATRIFSELNSLLIQGARAVFDYSARLEQTRIAFSTLLGGVVPATQHLKELQKFALETPFEFEGLVDASRRMQAMGFSAKQVIPILTDVGNAVAAIGGNREVLDRVILALSQMQAKGKVTAQEMNQLAETGIPAWRILAEAMGKSTSEVMKLSENGEISSKVFLDAFRKFSQMNFGDMMEKQSHTFQGAMSNITDTLLQTASTAFEPLFKKISEIADRIQQELTKVKDLESVGQVLADRFSELGGVLGTHLAQGIGAKLASPSAWISYADLWPRAIAEAIKGGDSVLTDSLREAVSGRKPSDTTAYDRVLADVLLQNKNAQAFAEAALQRQVKQTTEATKDNTDANMKADKVYVDLANKISDVSSVSMELATRQQLLRAGVTDLNVGFAELAIRLARSADAAAEAGERQRLEDSRIRSRNDSLRLQMESLRDDARMQIIEIGAAEKGGLTPIEKFTLGLGAQAEAAGDLGDVVKVTREQVQALTDAIERQKAAELQGKNDLARASLIEQTSRDLASLGQGLDGLTNGRRSTELDRTVESLIKMKGLRLKQEDFEPLMRLTQQAQQNPEALGALTDGIRKLLSFSGAPGLGENLDQATAQITNFLLTAAQASTLAGAAIADLNRQIEDSENTVAIASETAALRYKLAWQDAENAVVLANDAAVVRRIQNQVFLAHQMDIDFARLNDGVIDFLAQQKTLQQTFQDVRTNTIRSFFDGIDSAIDKMTKRLGVAGTVLGTFLKDLAHLAASQFLQRLLGIGTPGGGAQVSSGGGGGILNLFGGGGGGGNAQSGGGGGGIQRFIRNLFGGGSSTASVGGGLSLGSGAGITAPASLSSTHELANIAAMAQGNVGAAGPAVVGAGTAGVGAAGGFSLAALGLTLGAGLGSSLGGQSGLGRILGGVGGGLLGGALGIVGGAALSSSFAASLGPLVPFLSIALPVALIAGPLLIAGAIIMAKNKQRQLDEKKRNQASLDTLPAVYEILFAAQRGELTLGQARAQFEEVHQRYLGGISAIKDSKTRRNALLWWDQIAGISVDPGGKTTAIWPLIEAAAKAGEQAKLVSQHLVPEFAMGGFVPYRGGMATLIKVRPGEMMIPPQGYAYGGIVPGIDRGVDSVYTMARPGTRVLTKSQQAAVRGFARGGMVGNDGARGDAGPIVVELTVVNAIGKTESSEIFVTGARSSDGQREVVTVVRQARADKEL